MSNRNFAGKTITMTMQKQAFQDLRKDFKKQGCDVKKVGQGHYEFRHHKTEKLLLVGLVGNHNYLVTCVEGLFSVKPK